MIRKRLDSGYDKTLGVLKNALKRVFGSISSRGGLLQFLYLLGLVALMAGFVDALDFPVANQGLIVYPGSGAQTIPEAVIDGFVVLLGGAGIYLAYTSGRQTTKPRLVNLYLAFALLLIVMSVLMGLYLTRIK